MTVIEVIGIVLGSTVLAELIKAAYGFVTAKINRNYKKEDENNSVLLKLKEIEEKIKEIDYKAEEKDARDSRTRILMFADDIRMGVKHSKDRFDSIYQDIKIYNDFCKKNPGFLNDMTASSQDIIKDCYKKRVERNDFL